MEANDIGLVPMVYKSRSESSYHTVKLWALGMEGCVMPKARVCSTEAMCRIDDIVKWHADSETCRRPENWKKTLAKEYTWNIGWRTWEWRKKPYMGGSGKRKWEAVVSLGATPLSSWLLVLKMRRLRAGSRVLNIFSFCIWDVSKLAYWNLEYIIRVNGGLSLSEKGNGWG